MLCILPKLNRFWYLRLQKWMQKKNIQAYSWKVVGNSIWKFQRGANGHQRRFWVGTWIMGYPRISRGLPVIRASLVAQMVKYLPAMRETWIQFLGQEDPLEKEMAIHSSTLAWKTPWTEEPGRLQSMGLRRVRHDWATFTFYVLLPSAGGLSTVSGTDWQRLHATHASTATTKARRKRGEFDHFCSHVIGKAILVSLVGLVSRSHCPR